MTGPEESIVVVIPFNDWNGYVLECVQHCATLAGPACTLWLLPDAPPPREWSERLSSLGLGDKLHIEPTGPGNPALKRNVALAKSDGAIFALVDSDAYPRHDWLQNARELLRDDIAVVAGPNVTPPHDPLSRRVTGRVMESPLGFGAGYIRHVPAKRQIVREMPTCNMLVRRLEGLTFREDLDTGEDMVYCADVRARGLRILYDPEVVVFHHRRSLLRPFARQFYFYGYHKGVLAKTGSDIAYLWQAFPALLTVYAAVLLLILALPLGHVLHAIATLPALIYIIAVGIEGTRVSRSVAEALCAPLAFAAAHLSYGYGYLKGRLRARA